MTSYPPPPADGDNDPTRSTPAAGGTGGHPSPADGGQTAPAEGQAPAGSGQGAWSQTPYPQGSYSPGAYPQGSYQQGAYQQGSYQQGGYPYQQSGAYPGGAYPNQAAAPAAGQPSYYSQPGHPGSYPAARGGGPEGPPPNFFGALFDVNFTRFATPSVIKVLYILIMIVVVLVWLGYVAVGFLSGEPVLALLAFVGGGLFALVTITFYRLVLEFFYAVVRMSEDIHNRR